MARNTVKTEFNPKTQFRSYAPLIKVNCYGGDFVIPILHKSQIVYHLSFHYSCLLEIL